MSTMSEICHICACIGMYTHAYIYYIHIYVIYIDIYYIYVYIYILYYLDSEREREDIKSRGPCIRGRFTLFRRLRLVASRLSFDGVLLRVLFRRV